ncbi:site-specific tyrosine recombinase XerD [Planctomycetes bacterium Pan216]|uniref:Site-specific tyrosine recombinase XerD n=1 Tax=Kolteria novifilia TaxID=2527975 RepID=A0A518B576_9BACT|nr:site-specific tyrosine recombinase XerD [Planctomycetes bacterium Pan216]
MHTFFTQHYQPLRLTGRSWRTVEQYEVAISNFSAFLGRPATLDDLSDHAVARLAQWMLDRGRSTATANKTLRHLRALWRFARKRKLIASKPRFEPLAEYDRSPRAWTAEEVSRLLDACRQVEGDIGSVTARSFWPALVLFVFDTGIRKQATLNLSPVDVDLESRSVTIPAELQKNRREETHGFSSQTAEAIAAMGTDDREFLFPWPHDRYRRTTWTWLNRAFRDIVEAADLDASAGHFQRLRRTRATLGEMVAPGSATLDLGHSRRSITLKHYIDRRQLGRSPVVDRLPRPGQSPPTPTS